MAMSKALQRGSYLPRVPDRLDFFQPFEEVFDDLFNQMFSKNIDRSATNFPKMDVLTDNNKFIIRMACPGLTEDAVNIELNDKELSITGKLSTGEEYSKEAVFYVKQLSRTTFSKTVVLPDNIKGEPEATLKDGMLTLAWDLPVESKPPPPIKKIAINKVK